MNYAQFKQIVVSKNTYDKLREISPNDSFNSIISKLIKLGGKK